MTTLVASKHFTILYESQKEHHYGAQDKHIRETEDWVGKRVGIAGYGSIGRQGECLRSNHICYCSEAFFWQSQILLLTQGFLVPFPQLSPFPENHSNLPA